MHKTKTADFIQTKMSDDEEDGTFSGIIAVHGNADEGGDVGIPGMFERTLKAWAESERNIPVLWAHDARTPAIGVVNEAKEVEADELEIEHPAGLFAKARLFIAESSIAREVYAGMLAKVQFEFSYGYDEVLTTPVKVAGSDITFNGLADVELYEISPVFQGMNARTQTIDVKEKPSVEEPSLVVPDQGLLNRLKLL